MYLRRCYRAKDGKRHAYWALVKSMRTARGPGQQVAEQLARAGIFGVLNFAPVTLALPKEVMVNDVDLAVELEQLAFPVGSSH